MSATCREPPSVRKNFNADHTSPGDLGDRPHPPAPRRPAGLPSVTPQDRGRRLRPDAECAALVDVGAVDGDAVVMPVK
jgi:hypothetical protein